MGRDLFQVGLGDIQLGGEQLGGHIESSREQLLPLPLQPEEQLAPGAGVAHVDEAGVGHEKPEDVGPDPVGGVRAEACAQGRVPVFDRLEQTHAPLLDQVEHVGPGLAVLVGDADHQTEIVHHQGAGGAGVALLAQLLDEPFLLLVGEPGVTPGLGQETVQRAAQRLEPGLVLLALRLRPPSTAGAP